MEEGGGVLDPAEFCSRDPDGPQTPAGASQTVQDGRSQSYLLGSGSWRSTADRGEGQGAEEIMEGMMEEVTEEVMERMMKEVINRLMEVKQEVTEGAIEMVKREVL